MKKIMIILAALTMVLSGCVKALDKEINETDSTILKGRVVEGANYSGIPNITVSVTTGLKTHCVSTTNEQGCFELIVDWSKIDDTYYLFLDGGVSELQKKEELMGFLDTEYNYKDIVLYSLPTFQSGGATYQVAPDPGNEMTFNNANTYCSSLTIYGLSGWKLPTIEELLAMYTQREAIGGFDYSHGNSYYWSSTSKVGNSHYYYCVDFSDGDVISESDTYEYSRGKVRPIRHLIDVTILKGRVVDESNNNALPNINVSVTNGQISHWVSTTDAQGYFELTVNCSKIDETYYLFLDGGPTRQMKVELHGLFDAEYNYNDIVLHNLPVFQINGITYQVAPTAGPKDHMDAKWYCDDLTLYGLSNWRLPSLGELEGMYEERFSIGGFANDIYWSSTPGGSTYFYYALSFGSGYSDIYHDDRLYYIRPIRQAD